jgi:hypothetical protein
MHAALRAQLAVATITNRHYSGVGFWTNFSVPDNVPRISPPTNSFSLDGTNADGDSGIQRRQFQIGSMAKALSWALPNTNCGMSTNSRESKPFWSHFRFTSHRSDDIVKRYCINYQVKGGGGDYGKYRGAIFGESMEMRIGP